MISIIIRSNTQLNTSVTWCCSSTLPTDNHCSNVGLGWLEPSCIVPLHHLLLHQPCHVPYCPGAFSIFPAVHSFICLLIHSSVYLSIHLSVHPSIYLFIHSFANPSIHLSIHLFIYPSIYLFIHPFIYLSIYLFIHFSIHPSIPSSLHPSICQSCFSHISLRKFHATALAQSAFAADVIVAQVAPQTPRVTEACVFLDNSCVMESSTAPMVLTKINYAVR